MFAPAPPIRWHRAFTVLALGFAVLLRALPVPAAAVPLGEALLALDHSLCLGGEVQADTPGPAAPLHHDCEACCLPAGRLALAAPVILALGPALPLPTSSSAKILWRAPSAAAPLHEAWSRERAQRGPPSRLA